MLLQFLLVRKICVLYCYNEIRACERRGEGEQKWDNFSIFFCALRVVVVKCWVIVVELDRQ